MGQGTYIVFVIAISDIINIHFLHSSNLELMIEAAFIAFMLWILLGAYLTYQAQGMMKDWYAIEIYAHDK
jgi:hypothetical protein